MPVSIVSVGSVSALGHLPADIAQQYLHHKSLLGLTEIAGKQTVVGKLPPESQKAVESIRESDKKIKSADNSVLYALLCARMAYSNSGWDPRKPVGINMGSSRGATGLFEKHHQNFLETGKTDVLTSPLTTLGNLASWVSDDLQTQGPVISHSITCSTALHALLNGMAWIQSGMAQRFLVGGAEAPLTPFTLAQMHALKIYSQQADADYPCRALDTSKTENTMVLGEGACVIGLEEGVSDRSLAVVAGVGYATEKLTHAVSLSADADCLQQSMRMAIKGHENEVDVVVLHAPGTLRGDEAELRAVKKVFPKRQPALTSNKWKIGHTFGASGLLSLEMALLMLQSDKFFPVPYLKNPSPPDKIKSVLINAVGFGGNAVSVLLKSVN